MTDEKQTDSSSFLRIEYPSYASAKVQVILRFDDAARYNLAANPVPKKLKGADLVNALEVRGAVLNDVVAAAGTIVPAYQIFDTQTGQRTYLEHHQNGKRQDPASGEAALQQFDAQTGMLIFAAHYTKGSFVKKLSSSEVAALNKAKGFVPPLPDDLKQYELTGAQAPQPN